MNRKIINFRNDFIIHVFETASTNYWQYIFRQNFADHQILIRNYHLENYQAAIIINDALCISVKYYQKWDKWFFLVTQDSIVHTLQLGRKKSNKWFQLIPKIWLSLFSSSIWLVDVLDLSFFRLSRTRNIQEHMIRIYLVVVNCELIDRAGLNNPQLWDTQKSLCSRFSNVPSSAYKVLTKPFMPFSIFKNIPNPISKCWRFIARDIFNLIWSMVSIFLHHPLIFERKYTYVDRFRGFSSLKFKVGTLSGSVGETANSKHRLPLGTVLYLVNVHLVCFGI